MTTLEVGLGIGLAAAVVGVVWLLWQRGALAARALAAEAGRQEAEGRLAQREAERAAAAERIESLTGEAAGLRSRIESQDEARRSEQAAAAKAQADAVAAARREGELRLERERAVIATERESLSEARRQTLADLVEMKQQTHAAFKALAGETLKATNEQFLHMAEQKLLAKTGEAAAEMEKRQRAVEQMVKPIGELIQRTEAHLLEMEKARAGAYSGLVEQVKAMQGDSVRLREETGRLVRALREPQVRGRYGEYQLRRVAELAGMTNYCDFAEQSSTRDDEGNVLRPDMIVKLPSERTVVVDAKMNFQAYMDAHQATTPDEQQACLERFARHVSEQAASLARKKYWTQYDGSPEFVVMFVPHDAFLDAALSRRPDLLDESARNNVILATPSCLIALLRAVARGYQEQKLARAAEEIRDIGRELADRCAHAFTLAGELGAGLEKNVRKYNEFVGSYQSRVEPSLRRMGELGVTGAKEIPALDPLSVTVRDSGPARLPG